jgi:proton-coupled amino acid transporter
VFTIFGIGIVMYLSIDIAMKPVDEAIEKYPGLEMTPDDRDYTYFDLVMLPIFTAAFINVFEGDQEVLNLYSEASTPQDFFRITWIVFLIFTFTIPLGFGYAAYFAFGHSVKSCVLYSLPNGNPWSIAAQIIFILTMMGSFVIHAQPLFYIVERSYWFRSCAGSCEPENDDGEKSQASFSQKSLEEVENLSWRYYMLVYLNRTVIIFIIVIVAHFLPGLNLMLVFIGAIYGTLIIYVNPMMFYAKAYEWNKEDEPDPRRGIKILGWIYVATGVFLGLYALGFFIWAISNGIEVE